MHTSARCASLWAVRASRWVLHVDLLPAHLRRAHSLFDCLAVAQANPGMWRVRMAPNRHSEIYEIDPATVRDRFECCCPLYFVSLPLFRVAAPLRRVHALWMPFSVVGWRSVRARSQLADA